MKNVIDVGIDTGLQKSLFFICLFQETAVFYVDSSKWVHLPFCLSYDEQGVSKASEFIINFSKYKAANLKPVLSGD